VTADEVEAVRSLTPEAARGRFAHAVSRARAAAAACAAASPAKPAACLPCRHASSSGGATCCVCAGAELAFVPGPERAEAAAAGRAVRRLLFLLGLWNQPAFFHVATHHMELGHACTGDDDAGPAHWDATARASRLCRE
jgi:hypothetical protein